MPKSVLFDREEVIERVTQLFWQKGYNGTSMQDLVDITGLNRSSIYNSFGDKFSLFEESLRHYQKKQQELMQAHFSSGQSPKTSIISFFEGMRDEVIQSKSEKGCFITNCTVELGNSESKVHDFLSENQESMVNMFTTLIKKAQEIGEIDPSKDARQVALYLFSNLHGLRLISILNPETSDIEGVTHQILKNL